MLKAYTFCLISLLSFANPVSAETTPSEAAPRVIEFLVGLPMVWAALNLQILNQAEPPVDHAQPQIQPPVVYVGIPAPDFEPNEANEQDEEGEERPATPGAPRKKRSRIADDEDSDDDDDNNRAAFNPRRFLF